MSVVERSIRRTDRPLANGPSAVLDIGSGTVAMGVVVSTTSNDDPDNRNTDDYSDEDGFIGGYGKQASVAAISSPSKYGSHLSNDMFADHPRIVRSPPKVNNVSSGC
jgi:hypothetical protein